MITAIVQARMGSTRLPGKVLLPILGQPMLALLLKRISAARLVDRVILATSGHPSDVPIQQFAQVKGIFCVRGAVDDVLDRYHQAAKRSQADHIVRITGDCPLIDPGVIDEVIRTHIKDGNDYTSNVHPPTYPDGMDVEVMSFAALDEAWSYADKPSEREHVTSYFRRDLSHMKIGNVSHPKDLSHIRLTVDEAEDFEVVKAVFEGLVAQGLTFNLDDIIAYLGSNPVVVEQNADLKRNAGFEESLKKDAISGAA
jgi:spore coat polysaccharide biosynthesis protein SpsF